MVLAAEVGAARVAKGLRSGEWERVLRGTYLCPTAGDRHARAQERALAQIAGLAARSSVPPVFSHVSAALLWGLTLWKVPARPEVVLRFAGTGRDLDVVRHRQHLPDDHVVEIAGVRVTDLERTTIDCVAQLTPLAGLVLADSALAAGARPGLLADLVAQGRGTRGIARVRHVLRFADPGAESAYESASRFVLLRAGLPVPKTQVPVTTRLGTTWSDWGWPDLGILGEYDGRAKYSDTDALIAEKRRQDAILDAGHRLVRVVRQDLTGPDLPARFLRLMPPAVRSAVRPRHELRA